MDIVIDLDDVICDLCTPFHKALSHYTGKDIPVSEWSDFNLKNIYGISTDELFDVLKGYSVFENAKPIEDSLLALNKINKYGFNSHIVTSRNRLDPTGEMTRTWLETHNIDAELNITCERKGKSDVVKHIRPILMVDDHAKNIVDCSPYSFGLTIIDKPWNQDFDESLLGNVVRKQTLSEAISLL